RRRAVAVRGESVHQRLLRWWGYLWARREYSLSMGEPLGRKVRFSPGLWPRTRKHACSATPRATSLWPEPRHYRLLALRLETGLASAVSVAVAFGAVVSSPAHG